MAHNGEKLAVGRIVKAFGVKGEVVVEALTDDPTRFVSLKRAYLGESADSSRVVTVAVSSIEPRGVRLRLGGVKNRTSAASIAGQYLFVDPGQRIRLPKGRYFVHEVVGLRVVDQEGVDRGTVQGVLKLPCHDVYVIAGPEGEFLLPAVGEFVREVDTAAGTMRVSLIEGLIHS
jgi:16S rRNA processing protein RimM